MKTKIIMLSITIILIIFVIIASNLRADNYQFDLGTINFEEGVVNVYYFWGDGCPRCAEQNLFFERIKEEIGDYFNLYKFEVWHNENNARIMYEIAKIKNQRAGPVPLTIIGEEVFVGFASWMEDDIINAIKEQSTNDFDVMQIFKER